MTKPKEHDEVELEKLSQCDADSKKLKLRWRDASKQILAACAAQSLVIQAGVNMSFSAVLIPQLKENDSPIVINTEEASWVASIVNLLLPLGSLVIGPLMDKFGRKKMCLLTAFPFFISWILHFFAKDVWYIYGARMLSGFGAGLSAVALVYVSETSHPKFRPMLLSFNSVFVTLGILLTFILGSLGLHWRTMSIIYAGIALMSFIIILFLPESPYWLMVFKNDKEQMSKSLRWIYPNEYVHQLEYQRILDSKPPQESSCQSSLCSRIHENIKLYKKPTVKKPFLILIIIFLFQQLSGAYVIIFYALQIFGDIGGEFKEKIDAYVSLVILGGIRFVMAVILAFISKKIGRRLLMFISSTGMVVTSFIAGMYLTIGGGDSNIPLFLVLGYVSFSSFGVMVIPWTLIGELFPVKVKGKLGGIVVSLAYLMMFCTVKIFPFLMDSVKLPNIFLFLAGSNFVMLMFLYFFLPETLGKSFRDIEFFFDKRI